MQWTTLEREVRASLRSHLAPFDRLAYAAHRLVIEAVDACMTGRTTSPSHAAQVQARLLVRL